MIDGAGILLRFVWPHAQPPPRHPGQGLRLGRAGLGGPRTRAAPPTVMIEFSPVLPDVKRYELSDMSNSRMMVITCTGVVRDTHNRNEEPCAATLTHGIVAAHLLPMVATATAPPARADNPTLIAPARASAGFMNYAINLNPGAPRRPGTRTALLSPRAALPWPLARRSARSRAE